MVCKHLLETEDRDQIGHHKPWSDCLDGAGELICKKLTREHTLEELLVVCEDSLLEVGLLLPGEMLLT